MYDFNAENIYILNELSLYNLTYALLFYVWLHMELISLHGTVVDGRDRLCTVVFLKDPSLGLCSFPCICTPWPLFLKNKVSLFIFMLMIPSSIFPYSAEINTLFSHF